MRKGGCKTGKISWPKERVTTSGSGGKPSGGGCKRGGGGGKTIGGGGIMGGGVEKTCGSGPLRCMAVTSLNLLPTFYSLYN
jgi:hypothetical protein